jgi:hypothetical protein
MMTSIPMPLLLAIFFLAFLLCRPAGPSPRGPFSN